MSATGSLTASPSPAVPASERALTVAVTGATGTLGPPLLERLSAQPRVAALHVLARRAPTDLPAGAFVHRVDVRDPAGVERAVQGADVVIHLAYALYGVAPDEDSLFATNVRGTLAVARAAARAGARRFVYTSSAAVYGLHPDNPQPLVEADAIRASARHFYARHKAQGELLVAETLRDTGTAAYVLRPCAVVGPHAAGGLVSHLPGWARGRLAGSLRMLAAAGLRPWLPAPPVPLQFVHEDDVAQAIELAALGAGPPGTYNLAGEGAVTGAEALSLLGVRALPIPRPLVAAGLRAVAALPPIVPAVTWPALVSEPLLIDSDRARRELGWAPQRDSRSALRSTREALGW